MPMTALLSSFRLIDLASQAAAVQSALRGLPIEGKLAWLAERGTLTTTRSAGWGAETFRFESRIGMSCVFFFRGDRIVLIGDNTTWSPDPDGPNQPKARPHERRGTVGRILAWAFGHSR
jgi:hypothetical protein